MAKKVADNGDSSGSDATSDDGSDNNRGDDTGDISGAGNGDSGSDTISDDVSSNNRGNGTRDDSGGDNGDSGNSTISDDNKVMISCEDEAVGAAAMWMGLLAADLSEEDKSYIKNVAHAACSSSSECASRCGETCCSSTALSTYPGCTNCDSDGRCITGCEVGTYYLGTVLEEGCHNCPNGTTTSGIGSAGSSADCYFSSIDSYLDNDDESEEFKSFALGDEGSRSTQIGIPIVSCALALCLAATLI